MLQYSDILAARLAIQPFIHRTPTIRSRTLSDLWGANIFLKLECWQKTGSFKPRGAFHKLLNLSEAERAAGVVGVSGGNHAQGLAYAAHVLGISSLICMPESTPQNYLSATRDYGAEIRLFPDIHKAFEAAEQLQAEGRVYVHPFDDLLVAAGQGTLGLEIAEEVPNLSRCFASIGGGGLIGGIATALKEAPQAHCDLKPQIIGVETEGADVMARTIAAGRLVTIPKITSIARTLGSPSASQLTFDLARRLVDDFVVVSDAEAVDQLFFLLERAKILVEPAAACCLAAAARQSSQFRPDENIVVLLCGGNVSAADLCTWHRQFNQ